jgi:hypothetical protein
MVHTGRRVTLTGVVLATIAISGNPSDVIHHPGTALLAFVAISIWFGIFTPLYGGFPISDEGGVNHMNMHPYIVPIAVVVFLIFFKPWRSLKARQ